LETKQELLKELFPPENDPNVGFKAFEILADVLSFKNELGLTKKWNRNYELGKNKHWKQDSDKASLITANLLFAHRTRTVNTLTDNNPTFNVRQVGELDPEKEEVVDGLVRTAEFWWQEQEQQAVLERSIINGETYGCTVEKVIFNIDLEYGIGEVEAEVVDPYHFGVYPVKTMDIQKADCVLHFWPMSVREARRRFPDKAERIRSDREVIGDLDDQRLEVQANSMRKSRGYFSTFAGVIKNMLNIAGASKGDEDEILMVEAWVKDYSTISENGKVRDKYPGNLRCITTCNGGEVVCSDRPNPSINPNLDLKQASQTYLFDKFPFSLTHSVTDTANPWGMCDYEQLEGLQIELDKTLSQFTLIKDKLSRLKIKNPKDSGVDNSEFTNAPGIINPANSMVSEAIKYMELPNVPFADLSAALGIFKDFFFLVAGTFELEQAQTPGREVIAYKAIAALLERAATMFRGKIRNYSKMIRERGRMYLSLMMNWYTQERWISYEEDGDQLTSAIHGNKMIIPAKLNVVSGSTMPVSKVQEREEAIGLFERQAIDGEELLKKMDWPQWKQVVKRMQIGPLSDLLEKLGKMGFPQQILQVLSQLQQIDMKDFERMLKAGEMPTAQQLLAPAGEQEQVPPIDQIEIEKTEAEIEKISAEIQLVIEQANTEKVEQAVKLAGVEFDKDKLAIERARMVRDIEAQEAELDLKEKEIELQVELKDKDLEIAKSKGNGGKQPTKSSKKREQGPYREKGMKSQNQRQ
jgi:hypothetical protein